VISRLVAALVVIALAGIAVADPEAEADRAFRAASQRAAAGDPEALGLFEALGTARPLTRWTDDAWAEAARLAERTGDFARARRALDQVIALGTDDALVRRARHARDRLMAATGGGQWDAIAREHQRLVAKAFGGGDPRAALEALEQLARDHPTYPQAAMALLAAAQGWEHEGEASRGIELLRAAVAMAGTERPRIALALTRALIRRGEHDEAGAQLDQLAASPGADRAAIAELREKLDTAGRRAAIRKLLWSLLAVIAGIAVGVLRREAGSWGRAARLVARPPLEVVFLIPVGAVLAVVAQTGNPLVAKAVVAIVLAGIFVAWISGALLEARRVRRGRIGASHALAQAVLAVAVVAGAAYLAIDRDRLLDLVGETWEHGPVPR